MITGLWPRSRHGARHPGLDLGRDEGPNWKMEPEIASYGESLTREEKNAALRKYFNEAYRVH